MSDPGGKYSIDECFDRFPARQEDLICTGTWFSSNVLLITLLFLFIYLFQVLKIEKFVSIPFGFFFFFYLIYDSVV